jgi:alpha-ketoglutarate-dependent taurine dioxygenase
MADSEKVVQSLPIEIIPNENGFGAKVFNARLENISDEDFQLIHDSLLKYKFLVLKNQENLTAIAQRAFSLRFGVLQGNLIGSYDLIRS